MTYCLLFWMFRFSHIFSKSSTASFGKAGARQTRGAAHADLAERGTSRDRVCGAAGRSARARDAGCADGRVAPGQTKKVSDVKQFRKHVQNILGPCAVISRHSGFLLRLNLIFRILQILE